MRSLRITESLLGCKPLVRAIMRRRLARSVLDRRPALIVLTYHAVDPEPPTYMSAMGVATSPRDFDCHMRWVKEHYETVSLADGIACWQAGELRRTSVAVAFDDGFLATLEHALPILERLAIPCTFFVNGAFLNGGRYWFDDVVSLESAGRTDVLHAAFGPCPGASYSTYLRRQAGPEVVAKRQHLAELMLEMDGPNTRYFDETRLTGLSRNKLVELGNHSFDHPRFSQIPAEEQRLQIEQNEALLAGFSNYRRLFALPFGKPTDWNFDTLAAAANTRHEFVTAYGGINSATMAGLDVRRIICDGVGANQLEEHLIAGGLGL